MSGFRAYHITPSTGSEVSGSGLRKLGLRTNPRLLQGFSVPDLLGASWDLVSKFRGKYKYPN